MADIADRNGVRRAKALDIARLDIARLEVLLCAMHAAHPRYSGMTYDRDKTLATEGGCLD